MHLFGRFYVTLEDAYNETEQFFVKHPLDINEPSLFKPIEYNGKYFIAIDRKDGQTFYARPFICVLGKEEPLTLCLNGGGPDLIVAFKEASEVEAIEVPVNEHFNGKLQVRFKVSTNLMCNNIEIIK